MPVPDKLTEGDLFRFRGSLIIEILSPSSMQYDQFIKLDLYRKAGVKEYWIVDPTKELVMVYRFEKETMEQYSFKEDIPVGIYDDFSIRVS